MAANQSDREQIARLAAIADLIPDGHVISKIDCDFGAMRASNFSPTQGEFDVRVVGGTVRILVETMCIEDGYAKTFCWELLVRDRVGAVPSAELGLFAWRRDEGQRVIGRR